MNDIELWPLDTPSENIKMNMLRILKGISAFLFFVAASIIIALPVYKAFYGPAIRHHQAVWYTTDHKKTNSLQFSEHSIYDTSWELIKRRGLSAPPLHLKVRPLVIISLLFGLFFFHFGLAASWFHSFRLSGGPARGQIVARYVMYQTFLI